MMISYKRLLAPVLGVCGSGGGSLAVSRLRGAVVSRERIRPEALALTRPLAAAARPLNKGKERACLFVELLVFLGHVEQELARRKLRAVLLLEALHHVHV